MISPSHFWRKLIEIGAGYQEWDANYAEAWKLINAGLNMCGRSHQVIWCDLLHPISFIIKPFWTLLYTWLSHTHACIQSCTRIHLHAHVNLRALMDAHQHLRKHSITHICAHNARTHNTHMRAHGHICTHVPMRVCTYAHTHNPARPHADSHAVVY